MDNAKVKLAGHKLSHGYKKINKKKFFDTNVYVKMEQRRIQAAKKTLEALQNAETEEQKAKQIELQKRLAAAEEARRQLLERQKMANMETEDMEENDNSDAGETQQQTNDALKDLKQTVGALRKANDNILNDNEVFTDEEKQKILYQRYLRERVTVHTQCFFCFFYFYFFIFVFATVEQLVTYNIIFCV